MIRRAGVGKSEGGGLIFFECCVEGTFAGESRVGFSCNASM